DALVPDLRGFLIGRLGFRRLAVVGCGSSEEIHERSLSERLTEEPPLWLSPERTACAAMVVPWFTACERRMRCAQAGGVPVAEADAAGADASAAPPTVPMVEVPPVAPNP